MTSANADHPGLRPFCPQSHSRKKYGKKFTVKLRSYDKAGNATTTTTRTWHR